MNYAFLMKSQDEADALSECPNFWVPRDVIDGAIFLTATPAEAAVAHLHELVHDSLPHDWSGAEYWVQVYHGGRGLAFHMDKDEHAMKEQGAIINPCLSSVLYLTGDEDGPVQSATVVTNQRFDHETGRMAPSDPTTSTLVFPRANTYCVFDGRLGHGVLDCGHDGRRVTFLINWWKKKPQNIDRAEPQITGEHRRIKREGTSPPHIECILPEVIEIEKSVVPEDGIIMVRPVSSPYLRFERFFLFFSNLS